MSGLVSMNKQDIIGSQKVSKNQKSQKTENNTPIIMPGEENNKELFLKMLVAQMQNQDPFNPQDPTQYVTQLSQFTMLEQTMTLNHNMEQMMGMTSGLLTNSALNSATSLIGKEVEMNATKLDESSNNTKSENKTIKGMVEGVHIKDGTVYMDVKDKDTGEVASIEYAALMKINEKN
ncbi:flagellar hook capping FlgD N-terminal domain-containing protein [Romboutsia sp. 1001216sp1]|uniref:flagellar hook assembly protein FlgD n=1 Tax=unclassified Romboutsia TaxID=2626894 RepID=UPI00189FF243|nr:MULTISPECIES: flagellar hook capping FlgD N-terminal domain-containing protein [unclassified Romboutsia]MDB8790846.1 flagellar hook capping FlgD N-terminal domain-containing protein [Romboutsia sp. 1001216sp1]MDB8792360.1 flagellar hook capping FlgD N-terminal domain-containing protein [Romboutsia sp. 1001216sp1]MDB8795655.1 flagellar hook capping FlgD N-terminal domain-containing protein [Romboutsia sp. 1001216sp1]MDB8798466.1 flagellar hook capping FlgD N-terminal domain-containing protein